MKKPLAILCIGISLVGCAGKGPESVATGPKLTADSAGAVAMVNGRPIPAAELNKPLYEANGLNMLLTVIQLEAAKQKAEKNHVVVTEEDVKNEMDSTLATLFRDNNEKGLRALDDAEAKGNKQLADRIRRDIDADNQQLLDQMLNEKHTSRAEFELVMRTNAYLRKIVEPSLKDAITDKMLEDGFRFQYGEKVQVRHIQCATWQDISTARKMLAEGQDFAAVARAVSRNAMTGPLGGELPPFSRQETGLSEAFKQAAFALKEGETSQDNVSTNGAFHIIKLEKRIPPKAVKFADVKDAIRKQLYEGLVFNAMKQLRNELAQDVMKSLDIKDPILKAQYEKRLSDVKSKVKGRDDTLKKLTEEREAAEKAIATQPTTAPATMPVSVPSTAPAQ